MIAIDELQIPGHQILEVLKIRPSQSRVVLRCMRGAEQSVVRVITSPVHRDLGRLIRQIALHGEGSMEGLPELVTEILEGYRVRAKLGALPGLPEILDAGLGWARGADASSRGYPYISARWIEGPTLKAAAPSLSLERRIALMLELARILVSLHERLVIYGDLKPENLVLGERGLHLIDLDTMRRVPDARGAIPLTHLTRPYAAPEQEEQTVSYLASDLYAFGVILGMVLGRERPGTAGWPPHLQEPWGSALERCLRRAPLDRPEARALLTALSGASSPPTAKRIFGGATLMLPDGINPPTDRYESTAPVSDPSPRAAPSRLDSPMPFGERAAKLVLVIAAAGAGAVGWVLGSASEGGDQLSPGLSLRAHLEAEPGTRPSLETVLSAARSGDAPEIAALARVWQQGWLDPRTRWNPSFFDEAERSTRGGTLPPGRLARATLALGACHKAPLDHPEREALCEEGAALLDALLVELPNEPEGVFLEPDALALALLYRENPSLCDRAAALGGAPPSPRWGLIAERCMTQSGAARDYEAWFAWSARVEASSPEERFALVFAALDPECAALSPSIETAPDLLEPGGWSDLCHYATQRAFRCPAESFRRCRLASWEGQCLERHEADGVPWDLVVAAAPTGGECVLWSGE